MTKSNFSYLENEFSILFNIGHAFQRKLVEEELKAYEVEEGVGLMAAEGK
jgi:hypothetical protein